MFLLRDTIIVYAAYVAFYWIRANTALPEWCIYPVYSVVIGSIAVGHWVLGHECGHGAFGNTKLQNDIVGFIIHSACLVPYFSWQYSHNKHHKDTNHMIKGETHVPDTKKGAAAMLVVKNFLGTSSYNHHHKL